MRRCVRLVAAFAFAGAVAAAPRAVSAEGLFDFLFSGLQKQQHQAPPLANFFADPSPQQAAPARTAASGGSGPAFCVRSCDGRYFPLSRGNASPVQMCQAFCPASPTKVFYGSHIDSASSASGQRYADSENAFAYRKALRADCTCNGRDPAGLAPVDPTLDSSLRAGDLIATTDGLVAYSGIRVGNSQTAEFTPVASYPGLTAQFRARLGEMKVAPVNADSIAEEALSPAVNPPPATRKSPQIRDQRAEAN
ncbi:MAG: DUF2865 domain-containing protein [Bradyrhizobium sp.]|nr:DUF2865 domain-containing protein [Bradyrhizobium sp.]